MHDIRISFFLLFLIFGKTTLAQEQKPELYNGLKNVGDIRYDPLTDKKDFFCVIPHMSFNTIT